MITSITKTKIKECFLEHYSKDIKEIDEMVSDFQEWFISNNIIRNFFTDEEWEVVTYWKENHKSFPRLLRTNNYLTICLSKSKYEERIKKLDFPSLLGKEVEDLLLHCETKSFRIKLDDEYPFNEDLSQRITEFINTELGEEVCEKLIYIHNAVANIEEKYSYLDEVLDMPETSIDLIKKFAPNIYKKVWKK